MYVDVYSAHWWSGARGDAPQPPAAVDSVYGAKLLRDCRTSRSSWPNVELPVAALPTGGRVPSPFAGTLRGLCSRAAERRGGGSPVSTAAAASGLCYRVAGILLVHMQEQVHGLTTAAFARQLDLSARRRATPNLWEAAVASEAAGFPGLRP